MIRVVIFDVGGVLVRTPNRASRQKWETRLGLPDWATDSLVFDSEMGTKAQLGLITEEELWEWIGQELKLPAVDLIEFRTDFWAGDVLDDQLVALIRRLRPRYQTAVISNFNNSLREILKSEYPIMDAFDLIVCSAEEKVMKPDPEIFQRALDRLGREPSEAVFIDDSEANVQAARKIGLQAIHFKPNLDIASELVALGVTGEEK